MNLKTSPFLDQSRLWPAKGRHILAQHDSQSIVVYQAYRPEIGEFAAQNGFFGGAFSYSRMSWIKPNFLWMMYRSGWGAKSGQEVVLAIRLPCAFFDEILQQAVPSSFDLRIYQEAGQWKQDLKSSAVRLQWDPDHSPTGQKVERRAIQLGLRGDVLERFGKSEALEIINISSFVAEQRAFASPEKYSQLMTPSETSYWPSDPQTRRRLGLSLPSAPENEP